MNVSKRLRSIGNQTDFQIRVLLLHGVLLALAISAIQIRTNIQNLTWPWTSFYPNPGSSFGDFFSAFDQWNANNWTSPGFGISYMPANYLFIEILGLITKSRYLALSLVVFLALLAILATTKALFTEYTQRTTAILIFLSSYPIWFMFLTGNLELLVLSLVCIFFLSLRQNKFPYVFIGLAISIKLIHFPLLVLFWVYYSNREAISYLIKSIVVAIFANILALIMLPSGLLDIGYRQFISSLKNIYLSIQMYRELMYETVAGDHFGHSLLNSLSVITNHSLGKQPIFWVLNFATISLLCVFISAKLYQRGGSADKFMFLASSWICLAYPTSTDYRLVYFCFVVVLALANPKRDKLDETLAILSILVIQAKPFFHLHGNPFGSMTTWLTPWIILLGLLLLLKFALEKRN